MTHDERGLLDAIRDDPDDDSARLVYATGSKKRPGRSGGVRPLQLAPPPRRGDGGNRAAANSTCWPRTPRVGGSAPYRQVAFSRGMPS